MQYNVLMVVGFRVRVFLICRCCVHVVAGFLKLDKCALGMVYWGCVGFSLVSAQAHGPVFYSFLQGIATG